MTTSEKGLNLIKSFEGLRLEAYQIGGVWHIGYGYSLGTQPTLKTITKETAEQLFRKSISVVENSLNNYNFRLNQNQFDALVSFFYNVGTGRIKDFALLLSQNPQNPEILVKMNKYIYSNGVVLNGLKTRREKEINLYQSKTITNFKLWQIPLLFLGLYLIFKIIK
jgi:lysozyme